MDNKDSKIAEEVEKTYLEFDQVMESLSENKSKSAPPWLITDPSDSKYFDVDQILERLKYIND